jgi:uncharacterized protein with HEPN domain
MRIFEETREFCDTVLLIQDAVIRNFQMIGESTKRLTDDFRNAHPEIPWKQMAAFRDVLIHDYMEVEKIRRSQCTGSRIESTQNLALTLSSQDAGAGLKLPLLQAYVLSPYDRHRPHDRHRDRRHDRHRG